MTGKAGSGLNTTTVPAARGHLWIRDGATPAQPDARPAHARPGPAQAKRGKEKGYGPRREEMVVCTGEGMAAGPGLWPARAGSALEGREAGVAATFQISMFFFQNHTLFKVRFF